MTGSLPSSRGIRDRYRLDVKQFIEFVKGRRLFIVDGLEQYARWLDEGGNGKRYSPATINRKIAAAKNRIRYAFRHSDYAADLRKRYQLEDVLKSVRLKKIDSLPVSPGQALERERSQAACRTHKGQHRQVDGNVSCRHGSQGV